MVRGLQLLSRIMSHNGRGSRPCPLYDRAPLPLSMLDHFLDQHEEELSLARVWLRETRLWSQEWAETSYF